LQHYINPLVSKQTNRDWLSAIAHDYFKAPVNKALSLGCGGGGLERHALDLGIAHSFDAFDVSSEAIDVAISEAKRFKMISRIQYRVADLNRLEFELSVYEAAFASQSIHHIENLEHYVSQVHQSLIPGGLFVFNEYIGPNQFQWTEKQMHYAQKLLDSIPISYRQLIRQEEGYKEKIAKMTIDEMNEYDPTEAIRSQDIIPAVMEKFELIERRDFGGTLLHLVLDNIAGNLSESKEGQAILQGLFQEERKLIQSGEISSDFSLIVSQKAG
ncbi:MAG: class I SAM-dependent methyltransferase, partial [Pseudomonadales bacterium]|nr:class I SAM-dependent methyltransferase [Pseudomonadales bacterium]